MEEMIRYITLVVIIHRENLVNIANILNSFNIAINKYFDLLKKASLMDVKL